MHTRTTKLATKVTLATASLALLSATPAGAAAETSSHSQTAATSSHSQTAPMRTTGSYLVKTYGSRAGCYAAVVAHIVSGADGVMNCRKIYYATPDTTNWQLWLTT